MHRRPFLGGVLVLLAGLLLTAAAQAQAQAFRTYLSGRGNDANPCSLVAPCRLLPAALAAVIDGGEVWMIDSANYNSGPVDINKSVTILAVPGALGSVVAKGGNAINIATAGVKVALRNLVIVPYVVGGGDIIFGIVMTAGAALTVENCRIANLPTTGIYVNANGASVLVRDTVIRGSGNVGLWIEGGAHATVTRSTISGNIGAVQVRGNGSSTITAIDISDSTIDTNNEGVTADTRNASAAVKVSVRNSQVVRNSGFGLLASSDSGLVTLSASNNVISNNSTGLAAYFSAAKVWASGNTVSDNLYGFLNYSNSALFESAGDNAVRNNGTDTSGAITAVPKL